MQVDLLRRAPLFAAMPDKVLAELAARATRRRLRRGQRVLGRGDATVIVLVTGRLEVVAETEVNLAGRVVTGRDLDAPSAGRPDRELVGGVIRSLVPPAVAGLSVAAGAEPTAELRAAEDSEIVVLPADAVKAALRRHPEAALAAIVHLGGVIGELSTEVAALRVHGLIERVRHRLRQLAAGRREVVMTHARLAEEVGGTRANVSRALARMEREGEITRHRGRIQLR